MCQGRSHARGRIQREEGLHWLHWLHWHQRVRGSALHQTAHRCTMRAMWRLRLALDVLRQAYGRMGSIAWLVAVSAGVVLIICIAIWAKTAPAP